jgi:hypothetical protein
MMNTSCCHWQQLVHPSGVLQLSNVLLCGAQQDINIQLDNKNGRFLNPAVQSTAARTHSSTDECNNKVNRRGYTVILKNLILF